MLDRIDSYTETPQETAFYNFTYVDDTVSSKETLCKRVALVSLPFFSLYEPTQRPASLVRGVLRISSNGTNFFTALKEMHVANISYHFLHVAVAVAAFAGNIFMYRCGYLLAVGQDLFFAVMGLKEGLQKESVEKIFESLAKIVNNSLYLVVFLGAGIGWAIFSLSVQILLNLYNSKKELEKEHVLEVAGHLLMIFFRGFQLTQKMQLLSSSTEKPSVLFFRV